jgi:hypothetical protein
VPTSAVVVAIWAEAQKARSREIVTVVNRRFIFNPSIRLETVYTVGGGTQGGDSSA